MKKKKGLGKKSKSFIPGVLLSSDGLIKEEAHIPESVMPADKVVDENAWNPSKVKLYGKMENNFHLTNKKALFLNMMNYYDAVG